ncbi:MAG: YicC family protein [Clostridia bacterium]|nr:YicC family protein [Clostridia bacterium]
MIKSMTAYGRARSATPERDVTVEIRSVNGRYLDCSVRLPRAYLPLEDKIKQYVKDRVISRGKVDVYLTVVDRTAAAAAFDEEAARAYVEGLRALARACELPDDLSASVLARGADLFVRPAREIDESAEWEIILPALTQAGRAFGRMREAEGEKTARDITQKMDNVAAWVAEAGELSRRDIKGYRARLEERLRQILADSRVTPDESRILTECAVMADRLAVDEEIARLEAHRTAFDAMLREGSPIGKKLDFLMQEFNREANTLGSKANDAAITALVVNIKNELEKIREQVQNIE